MSEQRELVPEGWYTARAEGNGFVGKIDKTGSEYLNVKLVIEDGPQSGRAVYRKFFLTENAMGYTAAQLKLMGATFPEGDLFKRTGLDTHAIRIKVEIVNGYNEVTAISADNGGGGGGVAQTIAQDELRERMRALLLGDAPEKKDDLGDVPF